MRLITMLGCVLLAGLPLSASSQSASPNAVRDLAAPCAICHGSNGVNAGGLPDLAGQSADYIVQQLKDFRDAKRPSTIMRQIAQGYDEQQYAQLGAYFAAQKSKK